MMVLGSSEEIERDGPERPMIIPRKRESVEQNSRSFISSSAVIARAPVYHLLEPLFPSVSPGVRNHLNANHLTLLFVARCHRFSPLFVFRESGQLSPHR